MNGWFSSSIFHTRDIDLTEKLDYSSVVALLGYSLILTLLTTFNVKDEATRCLNASKQGHLRENGAATQTPRLLLRKRPELRFM